MKKLCFIFAGILLLLCLALLPMETKAATEGYLTYEIENEEVLEDDYEMTDNVMEGTKDADVIYTDVWVSMGEADEVWKERINLLKPYQVNKDIMNMASKKAIFLHCLPSFHDLKTSIGREIYEKYGLKEMEVTDEVFESAQSVVFKEAENRMHTIKAVMAATL